MPCLAVCYDRDDIVPLKTLKERSVPDPFPHYNEFK